MCRHPAPSKPKPQGGRSLASPDPGDCRHTASSIPEPAQRVLLCWDCHPSLGRTGPRVLGWDLLVQPRSSASQTRHAAPLPGPGCLLGTEDAHGQAGLSCVSSQGRDVPRLAHMARSVPSPQAAEAVVGIISQDDFT